MDPSGLVEHWLDNERLACLESLTPPPRQTSPTSFDIGKMSREDRGPSVRDFMEWERRQEAGEALSDEEQRQLTDAQAQIAAALRPAMAAFDMFSEPDKRSESLYRREVGAYIDQCRKVIEDWTEFAYHLSSEGLLQLVLRNPTDVPFEGLILELTIIGSARVLIGNADREEVRDQLPPRPRAFGTRRQIGIAGISNLGDTYHPFNPLLGHSSYSTVPDVQVGPDSTSVRFPAVTLRPEEPHLALDQLHLIVDEPEGFVVSIDWEASCTNATGRVRGNLSVSVSSSADQERILRALVERRDEAFDAEQAK
jgi:hypothetical protein